MSLARRDLLALLGAGFLQSDADAAPAGRPLRGIFPIAQTPFTENGALDLEALVSQLRFLDRGRVHGCVWPQLASEWSTLTEAERLSGAEALLATGKSLKPAIVIGVQGPDAAAAVRYARHAAKHGADALIALPPPGDAAPDAVVAYYTDIGRATDLPVFVQAVGRMSVETILKMWKAAPAVRLVKDEAGEPLMRVGPLMEQSKGAISVFTGGHGKTLIDEMHRGMAGTMPAASIADVYASVWDLWQSGHRAEAMDLFGKVLLFITEVQVYGIESLKYILYKRGVFKTWHGRKPAEAAAKMLAAGGLETRARLDQKGREVLDQMIEFVRPHFRA